MLVIDHILPNACSLRILRDGEVGLQAHDIFLGENAGLRRLCDRRTSGGYRGVALEQNLKEELGVKRGWCRVEGKAIDMRGRMSRKKLNKLRGGEASVRQASEDGVRIIGRQRNESLCSGDGRIRSPSEELKLGRTGTVGKSHCTGELNKVTYGYIELPE